MHGKHCIKSWAVTQATVALSSAEAELYALLKGATQTLGLVAIARDFGRELEARVRTDAQATLGIVSRQGLGKLRHIDVQYLWIQERVKERSIIVDKVPGAENPADLFTKYLASELMSKHLEAINVEVTNSRASSAPQLNLVDAAEPTTGTGTAVVAEAGDAVKREDWRDSWHGGISRYPGYTPSHDVTSSLLGGSAGHHLPRA